jgi:radical SAM/Cys-rich protein
MTRETMLQCLEVLERGHIPIIDLTGGAPEMNPHFRWLVAQARQGGCQVIDRCNLTILLTPGCDSLPEFLAGQGVEVVASLPCYTAGNTDAQRGEGVFAKSLLALKKLNRVGYGISGSGLRLALVFNPQGPSLPPSQVALEADYRREMKTRFGVVFNRLFTLTNMPIGRFQQDLARTGRYVEYLRLLKGSFNPAAAAGVMCRTTLSVGWEGRLFDCDFNQMLGFGLEAGLPQHIGDFDRGLLASRPIVTGPHCFGCTAGNGSGCQGAIV